MRYAGIDPGVSGAVVILDDHGRVEEIHPLSSDLWHICKTIVKLKDCMVCIEDVHSVYGMSAKSNFKFGWIVGAIQSALTCNGVRWHSFTPKQWQSEIILPEDKIFKPNGRTDTKKTSLDAALRIFGKDADFRRTQRSRVWDHNITDAALIAEYCRKVFNVNKKS